MPLLISVAKYVVDGDSTNKAVQTGMQKGHLDAVLKLKPALLDNSPVLCVQKHLIWIMSLGCLVPLH